MSFQGFCELEDSVTLDALVKNASDVPTNADALPAWRVYGPEGLIPNQTGSCSFRDSGTVTGATNAAPIVVTSAGHGLSTGTRVTLTGVLGNTGANGTFVATRVDADTFSLNSSTGTGAYTSGGAWNVTGLYAVSLDATAANGYESGVTYTVLVTAAVSGSARGELITFTVG